MIDSHPKKPAIFFNERFVAARHEEGRYEQKKKSFTYSLACKRSSKNEVGVARGIVFQKIRPGAGFDTGDFIQERLWGLP